jgi:hypothetical protein
MINLCLNRLSPDAQGILAACLVGLVLILAAVC